VDARGWIDALELEPHPEGGWFRRTWTHDVADGDGRALASSIHYLLRAGERSHWHRIDASETWMWHAGGALHLLVAADANDAGLDVTLGDDPSAGQLLAATVAPGSWQSAEPAPGAPFVLVSCIVVPEFRFEGFELAPPRWAPGG
jgi:predicted cupin superfamily sugar epimerase